MLFYLIIITYPICGWNIFPKRKEDSFDKVELIPVWCCKFDINGDINVDYALRFNAITGEEIS